MFNTLQPHGVQHARLPCSPPHPKFAQAHVHWVGGAIQPPHSLSRDQTKKKTLVDLFLKLALWIASWMAQSETFIQNVKSKKQVLKMENEGKLSQKKLKSINGKWCWCRIRSCLQIIQNKTIFRAVSLSCSAHSMAVLKDTLDLLSFVKNWMNSNYEIYLTRRLWWFGAKTSIHVLW